MMRDEPRLDGRGEWIARGVLALSAVATFGWGVPGQLVSTWDDGRFLIDNPDTTEVSLRALRSIVLGVHFQAYHPLHLLSYWMDVPWVGTHGPTIHAVNVALWCVVLGVVQALFRRLGLALVPATLATLLFGVHTVHVEAVTWATGRKEIFAIGLASASALAHLTSTRWDDRRAWLARVLFVLAALAKTTVLPLPAVLTLADVVLRRRPVREALRGQLPSLVVAMGLGLAVVTIWSDHHMIRGSGSARGDTSWLVPGTVAHHLLTALWPARTSPLYPLTREAPVAFLPTWIACGLLAAALAWAWRARRSALGARALFGIATFLLLLAPVSNVVPLYFQWQDRYLCFPLIGLAFVAGALVQAAPRPALAWGLVGLAVLGLGARTAQYAVAWRSDVALWENAVGAQPRSFYAWIKLGEVRRDAGQLAGALRAYARAIEVAPGLRLGHAAFLSALIRRDEMRFHLPSDRAALDAQRFMERMDDSVRLRELAGELAEAGYRDGVTFVLGRAFDVEPVTDEQFERAALTQLHRQNRWLARFYVSRLRRPPLMPELQRYVAAQRARLERERDAAVPVNAPARTFPSDPTP